MLLQKLAMRAALAHYGLAKMAMPPSQEAGATEFAQKALADVIRKNRVPPPAPINFDANPRLNALKEEVQQVLADHSAQIKKDNRNATLLAAAALITPVVGYGAYQAYQAYRPRRADDRE